MGLGFEGSIYQTLEAIFAVAVAGKGDHFGGSEVVEAGYAFFGSGFWGWDWCWDWYCWWLIFKGGFEFTIWWR
jgi:hypothetical protein